MALLCDSKRNDKMEGYSVERWQQQQAEAHSPLQISDIHMQLETHELQLNKISNAYRLRYIPNLVNDFCTAARAESLEKEDRKPEEERTTATMGVKGHLRLGTAAMFFTGSRNYRFVQ